MIYLLESFGLSSAVFGSVNAFTIGSLLIDPRSGDDEVDDDDDDAFNSSSFVGLYWITDESDVDGENVFNRLDLSKRGSFGAIMEPWTRAFLATGASSFCFGSTAVAAAVSL